MGNNKEKNNKSSFKIILVPIYFIWYIVFGAYVVIYSIFKFIFDIFKYIFIGLKTILYFVFYPIISLKNNQKNNKKQNVADRHFDGKIIDSQDKVDCILEKKNKQILKIEQKKLKKEKNKFEQDLNNRTLNEEKKQIGNNKNKRMVARIQKQTIKKLEKKHKKEALMLQKEEEKKKQENLKIVNFSQELATGSNEKLRKQIAKIQNEASKKLESKQKRELAKQEKIAKREKFKNEKEQQRQERLKQEKLRKEEIREKKKQKELDKKEAQIKKKKQSEAYVSDKVSSNEYKEETGIKGFLKKIKALPKKISQSFKKSYENSLLYKNNKNKKDKNRQILLINFDGEDAVKSEQKQVYEYVGKNAEGKIVKDYFPAFSRVEVHSFLLSEGFEVYSIRTSKWINLLHKTAGNTIVKFKTKDLIFFLTQLSTYIKAGIPLVESLKILSRQFKNKNYQKLFRAMIYDLTMGENFSSSMEKQGNAFPKLLVNMIKASEMTGELPEALDDMAEYYTEADQTRKQMITALTYPSVVMIFALGVITFIMVYVVPKFVDIYKSMDEAEIPSFTLFVMSVSNFLQKNLLLILIGIVVLIIVFMILYKNVKAFRWAMQWVAMHIPVVKNIIIYNEVTMFTKTFSSLLSHNVFITDTLEILSKITNNEIYKMLVKDTAANLERGEKISAAYKDQWAFPIPAYEMIVTGEKTGQLAEMMSKVSKYYQDLHKNAVARIKAFVEPILIVMLTVVVGFIVLSIVIPMFNMYNAIM